MISEVSLCCRCRLLGCRHDSKEGITYATFVFEGGKFDLQLPYNKVVEKDYGHMFQFFLRCETTLMSVQGKEGRNFQVTQFRPLKGVLPVDFKCIE